MRLDNAKRLLEIAIGMQSFTGMSLKEIREKYSIDHRTAQRYREAVTELFPNYEVIESENRERRWRISPGTLDRLLGATSEEVASLKVAARNMQRENMHTDAARLLALKDKILVSMKGQSRSRIETDAEFLAEHEQFVVKPGPSASVSTEIYQKLRHAVLSDFEIEITYAKQDGKTSKRRVRPYGFLMGHRHYLLATEVRRPVQPKLFALPRIKSAKATNKPFNRNPEISVRKFAESSFGVFIDPQGPVKVKWLFSPTAAPVAREFLFHPTQKMKPQKDGSLLVEFEASGLLEMAWHLCMWGDQVEVIEPKTLKDMVDLKCLKWDKLP